VQAADLIAAIAAIRWADLPRALWGGAALVRAPGLFFGGAAIAAFLGCLAAALARSRKATAAALAALPAAGLLASILAYAPTRNRVPGELARYGIDVAAARRAGPLLDAKALFLDELRFLRNRGREREARDTEELIRAIDRELDKVAREK
jgi:hypothetical protein